MVAPVIIFKEDLENNVLYVHNEYVKRVRAFMMAWHPRVGKDACISKIVPKDVAKWFCKEYLKREKYGQIRYECTQLKILMPKIVVSYVKVLNGLGDQTMMMIQTPFMYVPFGLKESYEGPGKYILPLEIDRSFPSHCRFQKNIEFLQHNLVNIVRKQNSDHILFRNEKTLKSLVKQFTKGDEYSNTFIHIKLNIDENDPLKFRRDEKIVTYKERKISLLDAKLKNYFCKGTRLRCLLHVISVWFDDLSFGITLVPREIQILRIGHEAYSFMSESDSE